MTVRLVLEVGVALLVSALGVVAAMLGETDDAPGLTGIGCLLVASAVGLGFRAGRRHPRQSPA